MAGNTCYVNITPETEVWCLASQSENEKLQAEMEAMSAEIAEKGRETETERRKARAMPHVAC